MADETLELARVVQKWHAHRVKQINLLLDAPADTEVRIVGEEGDLVLTGERLLGFRAGMATARSLFEKLPFSLEPNTEEEE